MATPRAYHPDLPKAGGTINLSAEEAHHLSVLRLKEKDPIILTDGKGQEAQARLLALSKKQAQVEARPAQSVSREPELKLGLAVALPHTNRVATIVRMAVELGVWDVFPLETQRGVRKGTPHLEKLQNQALAAIKQCGRNRLPTFHPIKDINHFPFAAYKHHVVSDPKGSPVSSLDLSQDEALLWVGPEGGFTQAELDLLAENKAQSLSLGKSILRVETAVAAGLALLGQTN